MLFVHGDSACIRVVARHDSLSDWQSLRAATLSSLNEDH
jgi:hypothetical protein